jgi:hypothetical protein
MVGLAKRQTKTRAVTHGDCLPKVRRSRNCEIARELDAA